MKVLVVYCHPVAESFCAAMRDAALRGLEAAGHETRLIDLYADNFDPRLTCEERLDYQDETRNTANVADQVALVEWAEGLVFVFPTWWYGLPAMLKGWFDRVWVPGVAFDMPESGKVIRPAMTHIRAIAGITSCGSPWWWMKVVGEPHRRIIMRGLAALCARRPTRLWLACYLMDTASEQKRERYLRKIEARMAKFA